jgi:transposase
MFTPAVAGLHRELAGAVDWHGVVQWIAFSGARPIAKEVHPEVALLKQVKGVGTLIALAYVLTVGDPHRFRRSRDVGCYLGLRPGRRNSGSSQPQLHISKKETAICEP